MDHIRSLLSIARTRIETSRFLVWVNACLLVAAAAALVLMNAERIGSELFVPWAWVAPTLAGLGLAIAVLLWLRGRPSDEHVAILVDERLDLREKLSTALHCRTDDDAFARAAVQDAVAVASDARTRERARRAFAIVPPPRWWITPLVVFVTIMLSWMGPLDLFGDDEADDDPTDMTAIKLEASVASVVKELEKDDAPLHEELAAMLDELTQSSLDPVATTEEQVRREAIKNLSELNRRLEDILDGERGKTSEALQDMMKRLEPTDGPAKEFAEALAAGDFKQAQEALKDLLAQMQNGELDAAQQEALAEQLEKIAEQLAELAKQQQELEQALKDAGLDPQLANNPQALQQAIQNDPNLNEQQKQQLQQMAQAQQAAQQMCQGLGRACQQMGQAMQGQGQMGQMGQAGQQALDQLGDMEQLQQLLQQAQAAANAAQSQCQGLGQGLALQQLLQQGGAFGQRGQSSGGGRAPVTRTPYTTKIEKANVETTAGEIISRMQVEGEIFVGETTKQASQLLIEVSDAYDEAVEEDTLPRKYHDAQKHYFGEFERRAREAESRGGGEAGGSGGE